MPDSPARPSAGAPVVSWRESRSKRFQAALIAAIGYPIVAALRWTLRWKIDGSAHYDAIISSGHQPILACWHARILPGVYYFRRRGIVAIAGTTSPEIAKTLREGATDNLKRVRLFKHGNLLDNAAWQHPGMLEPTVETKTVWHPVGA